MAGMTPVVEAQGSALIHYPADRWRLILRVQASSSEAEAAFRRRTRAVTTTQRVLATLAGTEVSGEQVEDGQIHHTGQITAGWTATVRGGVSEHEQLRELIARLAGVEDIDISGPHWDLSTQAQRAAREKALEAAGSAARTDAETMARTLGGRCGPLLKVSSGGPGAAVPRQHITMMGDQGSGARESLPARTLELDVDPDVIEVQAVVAVTFEFFAG